MILEDYFDFQRPDDIRIAGTRVGIETILLDYLHQSRSPEEIAERYPSVSLEQVYATILYYLHEKTAVEAYLNDFLEWQREARNDQRKNLTPGEKRLLQVKEELAGYSAEERAGALRRMAEQERVPTAHVA